MDELYSFACRAIDDWAPKLRDVSHEIWLHPELVFEEHFAHDALTKFLEDAGFDVERHYTLQTAFRGRARDKSSSTDAKSTKVAVICEYDALPDIGHACGHNLIAEAGLAAAIGIKAALEAKSTRIDAAGELIVLGTPAEEGGGGKVKMIKAGCFDGLWAAMMVHPCPSDLPEARVLSVVHLSVTYKGKASHAAAFPWEGINALDAAVGAYTGLSMLRQQMKPTCRLHAIITEGGVKPNIIPEVTKMSLYVRAPTDEELSALKERVIQVLKSAGDAAGCSFEIDEDDSPYSNMCSHANLLDLYVKNVSQLGIEFDRPSELPCFSTDMGNVSHVVPSIHPWYSIGTDALNHTKGFTAAADTDYAHKQTLIAAKAMAMTAIQVLCNPDIVSTK
ncbi:xaa-Arg dipeptidase-like [Oscarella lobularis]|uniref:xaa-Arg dipeptidase-like n=1 Tax=Oscarella lobularis TaxID=121494 RepID=UPI0033139F28